MLKAWGKREHRNTFVTTDMEYPSNLLPWAREKCRVVRSDDYLLDAGKIEKAVDERTISPCDIARRVLERSEEQPQGAKKDL